MPEWTTFVSNLPENTFTATAFLAVLVRENRNGFFIVDGHNRYRIATKHNLPYEVIQKDFESREHALNWIIANQLGRRNLNPTQLSLLRGEKYESDKRLRGGDGSNQYVKKEEINPMDLIAKSKKEIISEQFGVSPATIDRDARFARTLNTFPVDLKERVLREEIKLSRDDVSAYQKMEAPIKKV